MAMSIGTSSLNGGASGPAPTWRVPLWRSVLAFAVLLPLSLLFARIAFLPAAMLVHGEILVSAGSIAATILCFLIGFALFVFVFDAGIVATAALFSRKAHVTLGMDAFWHFQLKYPLALSSIRRLTVHGTHRTRGFALTLSTDGPVPLRFPSLFNLKRLISPCEGRRQFTFSPGLFAADTDEFIRVLAQVVRLHGGSVVH
jgi:hypothetical protein